MVLRKDQDHRRDETDFDCACTKLAWQLMPAPRIAAPRAVVAQGVLALAGVIDGHLVGQGGNRSEEPSGRNYGLE